ncbi:phosphate propanoyltransferase [Sporanaerobium hydrogeniformans]|uniref:Phosphate propanoyltransferase n=1 Tax=Sporanaerobium hydrogeniformans TaxID=3072179 RepID=A0AC61D9J6_9FIRM|nr:phosphate propanoyltransferase [Sporanaerobium hydrogeniformans]PHV69416.1 phosphate propanoyltransferase [Sporanaerobium hydrogeniformans]
MVYYNVTEEQIVGIIRDRVEREMQITKLFAENKKLVPTGISVRHIHLSRQEIDKLFGEGYELTFKKGLSQPGQFACKETLKLIGPKGSIEKVRVLGPARHKTQIEVAFSDARQLGISPPVRTSGDIAHTPGVILRGPQGECLLSEGVIIADRHIHMSPVQATYFNVSAGDKVCVKVEGAKAGIMDNVTVRIGADYWLDFHIDTDDGNAFRLSQGQYVTVLDKKEA